MELCSTFITTIKTPPNHHRTFTHRPIKPTISLSSKPESTHPVTPSETLQNETFLTLEWPSVCNQVSAFTSTTMGLSAAQSGRLPLGRTPEESRNLLNQTAAALALPRPLDFSGIEDVSEIVNSSVSGELVSIGELCAVKRTLKAARTLYEQLEEVSLDGDSYQRYSPLLEILRNCNFLTDLEQKIEFCVDCNFSIILDRASEDLGIIRSERKRNMENLDSLLKRISAQIFQAGGIDRPLITNRRSRMCVGIRASHRYLLPNGVVLNVSSSGATYFMEPKEAVELNNMEVRHSNSEKAEERTILTMLTSEIAESDIDIYYLLERILEIDLAFARAGHAQWMNGVCPILSSEVCENIESSKTHYSLSVDIEGIQHPLLLENSLRSLNDLGALKSNSSVPLDVKFFEVYSGESDFPVPIDIKIGCQTRVVVISGPNTGGKTASMKTLGLASVMSKAGMYLPAKNQPRLPWFDLVLADIGDLQSLEHNLSTFSGHISRLCKILEVASKESLVLIDEIVSGTDPSEGVALSASILQYFKDRVGLAVVTTHYADLSRLKEKYTEFENAAMEFSLETLQPTYRILWGSVGDSNALSIAKSIGFDEKIIERAEKWAERLMPEKQQKRQGLLFQSLMEERNRLETQARRAASLHSDIMNIYHEIRNEAEDLDGREEALKAKEIQLVEREIKTAKSEIESVLQEFENQLRTARADQFNSLVKKSESAIASIVEAHCPSDGFSVKETESSSYTPQLGEQVLVKGLGNKLATIVEAPGDDDTVLVQYGKIRVRVDKGNIRALQNRDTNVATRSVPQLRRQGSRSLRNSSKASNGEENSYGPVVQTSKNTVDLRGMRVEEASHHLNMAISARGSNSVVYVIHGMGTGVVKECAIEILRNHPRVAKFEQESPMNYGCTVAYINDWEFFKSYWKMLAVFEKMIGKPPEELSLPSVGTKNLKLKTRKEIVEIFRSWRPDSTLYNLANGNFMALSHEGESPSHPRSIVVVDEVFCIFAGTLDNTCDLRRYYGLSRQATEAMVMVEAYKVLRDRAPYPPDQVIKDLEGKFAFILFDARASNLFLARDRDGYVQLRWGMTSDGSLICSDDPEIITEACGNCYTPFPPGCIFMGGSGLISFDHPLNKVRAISREDDKGNICAVIFQVDMYTRLHSIPRTGSAVNWANAFAVDGE